MNFPNLIMHNLLWMIIDFNKESLVLVNFTLPAGQYYIVNVMTKYAGPSSRTV
jgi:hypothetical protein